MSRNQLSNYTKNFGLVTSLIYLVLTAPLLDNAMPSVIRPTPRRLGFSRSWPKKKKTAILEQTKLANGVGQKLKKKMFFLNISEKKQPTNFVGIGWLANGLFLLAFLLIYIFLYCFTRFSK